MVDFKPQRIGQVLGLGDNPLYQSFGNNRNAFIQGFAGLGSDPMNPGGGFSRGFATGSLLDTQLAQQEQERAQQAEQTNATIEYLRSKGYNDLLAGVEGGGLDIGTAWAEALKRGQPATIDPFTLGPGQIRYGADGQIIAQGPGQEPQTIINNQMGGTDEFYGQLDKNLATQTTDLINAGMNAQSNNIRLGELENVLATAPQGMQGNFVQMAGSMGLPVEGASEIQAAQALINQMVPGQRPAGSGTMSDADLALFKASLPAIINQPGGNQKILTTMKAINEYTIAQAEIAQAVANRQLTPAEGRELSMKVPNPLARNNTTAPAAGDGWQDLGNGIRIRPIGQ